MKKSITVSVIISFLLIYFSSTYIIVSAKAITPTVSSNPKTADLKDPPDIKAEGAILIDTKSGSILYEKNKDEKLYPASTTKIITALIALKRGKLDDIITANENIYKLERGSTIIGLKVGEQMNLEQLLYGMLLISGNDAAVDIASHFGVSIQGFADIMNQEVSSLGLKNTHFTNPDGLFDTDHYTTAYDLSRIALEAIKYPEFRKIVSTYEYKMPPTNICHDTRVWHNTNHMLNTEPVNDQYRYGYATGIKTGYTSQAHYALVSMAEKDGNELLTVLLKDDNNSRWTESAQLFDYGFANFKTKRIFTNNQIATSVQVKNTDSKQSPKLDLLENSDENQYITYKNGAEPVIDRKITLYRSISAPIKKGQILGKVVYSINKGTVKTTNLISSRNVDANTDAIFLKNNNNNMFRIEIWQEIIILLFLLIIVYFIFRKRIVSSINLSYKNSRYERYFNYRYKYK